MGGENKSCREGGWRMKDVKFTRQQLTLVVPRANLRDKLHSLLGQVPSINHQITTSK